jgi:chromosome segregation ATPase
MAGLIPGKLTHVDDGFEYVIRELNKVRCDSIGDQLNLLRKQIKLMWGMVAHLRWVELRQRRRIEQIEAERDAWREAFDVLIGKCDAFTQLCGNIEHRLENKPDDLDTIKERIKTWRDISESVTKELNEMYAKYPPDHAVDQT